METLKVYQYRALVAKRDGIDVRWTEPDTVTGFQRLNLDILARWEQLSDAERLVIVHDTRYKLVLVDVDVLRNPGWPVRVWERASEGRGFPDKLRDWRDADGVAYHLARSLGILGPQDSFGDTKWIFWSNNPLGNTLCGILDKLVEVGVLEFRDEPDVQFRWNAQFKTGKGGE